MRPALGHGLQLGLGQVFVHGASFLRNVIIARVLSPSDFGIAATFAIMVALLEMASALSVDKLLIQSEDGDQERFQRTAQFVLSIRGALNGAILFLLADSLAPLFGAPEAVKAFRYLALLPVLHGLIHLDSARLQRRMAFGPMITVDIVSHLCMTAIVLPLALWLHSYWVMLWVSLGHAAVSVIVSNLVAERDYAWALDWRYARRIFEFGWPLLVNGILLYIVFHGDRLIIGTAPRVFELNRYTLEDLGVYSVAFALAMAPTLSIANVSTSLFLPTLSRVQSVPAQFERRYATCARVVALIASMVSMPLILSGGPLVTLIYGTQYAAAGGFIGWVVAMWAVRTIRIAPTLAAMARGDTRIAMIANAVRTLSLLGVLGVASVGRPMVWIAACGFGGEVAAFVVSLALLQRRHGIHPRLCAIPALGSATGLGLAAILLVGGISDRGMGASILGAVALMAVMLGTMFAAFPGLREDVQSMVVRSEPTSMAR